ncbi:hypothetical protein F8M41_007147 [Gigaspora margarita]|uniref:Uncharacterized protein n=1 Tax=Gigaspora margarita TaxID=4874 RepID=A0A8H4AWH7_GIGMA|nr:hypothetical protein F8M41_007147 [Gigaspora margarita]
MSFFSESGIVQFWRGVVPTSRYGVLFLQYNILLWHSFVGVALPRVIGVVPSAIHNFAWVKEFWERFKLERKVANERITFKKKTELDAIKVLDTVRTKEKVIISSLGLGTSPGTRIR